jgi:hypothetical protein
MKEVDGEFVVSKYTRFEEEMDDTLMTKTELKAKLTSILRKLDDFSDSMNLYVALSISGSKEEIVTDPKLILETMEKAIVSVDHSQKLRDEAADKAIAYKQRLLDAMDKIPLE